MSEADLPDRQSAAVPAFLANGGETGELIAARDWSATPLGPIDGWPQSLRTATAILLRSPVPMVMLWGPEGVMLYNDAYSVFAGGRHPGLLGSNVREGWPEVADFNDNVMKVGLGGGTLAYRDQELTLYRHGRPEQVWMDLDYSPVPGDDGRPAGVLGIVAETTGRVQSDRQFRSERERLDAVLESINDCFYALDRDWRFVVFNRASEAYFGISRADVLGRKLWALFPQGIGTDFERHCRAAMDERVAATMQTPSRLRADRVVELRIAPMGDGGISVALSDITERVRAEQRLRESEARFRNMADHAPVMMWVTDRDGHCTYLNRAWYEFTGQTEAEAEGFGWLDATHPDDKPLADEVFRSANARHAPFRAEYRLRRADGTYRWALDAASPRFDDEGRYLGYVGSVIDIDERREAEERLRDNEERLRLATEAAEIGFWDLDVIGDRLIWPPSVKAMFGISPDVPVTMDDFYAGLHPDDREATTTAFAAAADPERRALYDVEYRTIGKEDRVIRWVAAKGRGVFDAEGRCVRLLGAAVDITARKRDELHQRLLINELNHRVKNTLAIVQGIAQQSFKGASVAPQAREAFEGRLGALSAAHDVLTRQNWEAASIRQIIDDAVAPYRDRHRAFTIDGPDLQLAPKTAVSLGLATHELATNAVKYGALSVPDGRVEVRWRVEDGRLRLLWRESGGPPVVAPERRGFGSRMIERGLAAELGGNVKIQFEPEGVVCSVDAPLPEARA
jgi:PAS domain S-box-containing protein